MNQRASLESSPTGYRTRLLRYAPTLVMALACIVFIPPVVLDGRFSHLEYALFILGLVLILALLRPLVLHRIPVPMFALALLAVMAASTLWSYARFDSMRDVLTFAVIGLTALVLVQITELNNLAVGVALSGVFILAWSGVLILIGSDGAFTIADDLLGPYGNRNGLAYALLQCVPAALAMRLSFRAGAVVKWIVVFALTLGIFATGSKTSLVVLLLVALLAAGYMIFRLNKVAGIFYLAVGFLVATIAAWNFESVLGLLGKTDSISGRIPMWVALIPLVGQRPLTGYGWSMSLPTGAPPSVAIQESLNGVLLFHAHNEILNWLITTGLIGAALVLSLYWFLLWAGVKIVGGARLRAASWIPLGAMVLLLRGASEISETLPQGWFVLMLLGAAAAKYLPEATGHPTPKWLVVDTGFPLDDNSGRNRNSLREAGQHSSPSR